MIFSILTTLNTQHNGRSWASQSFWPENDLTHSSVGKNVFPQVKTCGAQDACNVTCKGFVAMERPTQEVDVPRQLASFSCEEGLFRFMLRKLQRTLLQAELAQTVRPCAVECAGQVKYSYLSSLSVAILAQALWLLDPSLWKCESRLFELYD